ncbi:carbonic anhydrase, partial [Streptomyces sp. NPDC007164]
MGGSERRDRRTLLAGGLVVASVALTGCSSTSATPLAAGTSPNTRPSTPSEAFARLMDGNERWVSGDLRHPDRDPNRREFV